MTEPLDAAGAAVRKECGACHLDPEERRSLEIARRHWAGTLELPEDDLSDLPDPLVAGSEAHREAEALIRLARRLHIGLNQDDAAKSSWLNAHNTALGTTPLQVLRRPDGVAELLGYLNSRSIAIHA